MSDFRSRRIAKWDNVKALLIFLVVMGHVFDYYTREEPAARSVFIFIYMFHMPLFLFVSGLFNKNTVKKRRWGHIVSYLLLYILIKFIVLVTELVLFQDQAFSFMSTHWVPWYAYVMFVYLCLMVLLEKLQIPSGYVMFFSILVACMAGYDKRIGVFLSISKTLVFFPFFYAGYCLNPEKLAKKTENPVLKVLSGVMLILFGLLCARQGEFLYQFRSILTSRYPYKALGDWSIYGGLIRLIYYAAAFGTGLFVISIVPYRPLGSFSKLGQNTLQVYSLHSVPLFFLMGYLRLGDILASIMPVLYMFVFPLIALFIVLLTCWDFWGSLIRLFIYPAEYWKTKQKPAAMPTMQRENREEINNITNPKRK